MASKPPPKSTQRGGRRPGAGRPKGSGQYKEPTKAIRVPLSAVPEISTLLAKRREQAEPPAAAPLSAIPRPKQPATVVPFPLYSSRVAAGAPSPADDHVDETLDLNHYMVEHPESTYMLKVEGESMIEAGIFANDILVVDRSLPPAHNKIVIASLDGQLTVKRLYHRDGVIKLMPENSALSPIEISDENELTIWGVVVGSLRKFQSSAV